MGIYLNSENENFRRTRAADIYVDKTGMIAEMNKPTLVAAHNKTLAAQLFGEFKEFFPENAVEYFVSYFDNRQTCDLICKYFYGGYLWMKPEK